MNFDVIMRELPALFCGLFVCILFIQSGLDKTLDWNGNLSFLKGHFSKTFLAGMVPMMLATITVMELVTGLLAGAGIVYYLVTGSLAILFYASVVGAASITALFFGQRIAKDYPGAAVLVPYFLLIIILMILTNSSGPRLALIPAS
jgi:hypothetical protein